MLTYHNYGELSLIGPHQSYWSLYYRSKILRNNKAMCTLSYWITGNFLASSLIIFNSICFELYISQQILVIVVQSKITWVKGSRNDCKIFVSCETLPLAFNLLKAKWNIFVCTSCSAWSRQAMIVLHHKAVYIRAHKTVEVEKRHTLRLSFFTK